MHHKKDVCISSFHNNANCYLNSKRPNEAAEIRFFMSVSINQADLAFSYHKQVDFLSREKKTMMNSWFLILSGLTYFSDLFCERVSFVAIFHEHLILALRLMLVIELHDIVVVHLLVDAALSLGIQPVGLREQLLLANDLLDHIQVGFFILDQGDLRSTEHLVVEESAWYEVCKLLSSLIQA